MTSDTEVIDATVTMYTTAACPYCIQAERLLRAKGVQEIAKVRVDLEPARRIEMMVKSLRSIGLPWTRSPQRSATQ